MKKKYWVFLALFVFSLGADQLTKVWARASLRPRHAGITLIDGYLDLRYSENEGSAFGLFRGMPGARYILFGVGIVALYVVATFLKKAKPEQTRIAAELGLLAGGAVGNLVDRVALGRVTDFVLMHLHSHEWPIFNVADAALVVGVLGLLIDSRDEKKGATAEPAPAEEPAAKKKRK